MKRRDKMKKKIIIMVSILLLVLPSISFGQGTDTYIVKKGDSLWKIAVKYQIGVREIIDANKQIPNIDLIYPNQKINIPNINSTKGVEEQVLVLVNKERAKVGVKPLQMDWELQRTARTKSCDMAQKGYFSHQSPTYGSPFDMMRQFGIDYRSAGENIASGQKTPEEVMQSWMNSQGHRENILKADFTHIGVGYCVGGQNGTMWTQMFISK
jgi:uncharacterized YkwD family protein/spore coat assembly protein SafA